MKDAATASPTRKKGEKIVDMNHAAIERGATDFVKVEVPESWKNARGRSSERRPALRAVQNAVDYVNNILIPANAYKGNDLPVSAFDRAWRTARLPSRLFRL